MRRTLSLVAILPVLLVACASEAPVTADEEQPRPVEPAEGQAPEVYQVKFETTEGDFIIEVHREWAPRGADRFYELVQSGFYDEAKFFRAVEGFVVQWGMNADPEVQQEWMVKTIRDDPVRQTNTEGYVTFAAGARPHTRSTQVFVNLGDNSRLDEMGFAPFGKVVEGLDVVKSLYNGYGEQVTNKQGQIATQGNEYLERNFPELDAVKTARIVEDEREEKPE